jgi:adenylate cyclase
MVQERPVRVERKLSAILAADVAGYSRLMHNDEEATHAKLTALLTDAVAPAIAEHGGRIVKNTGDGFLAEFPSAVQAVRAAAQFQTRIKELTISEVEDRRIAFRVGVNIGDVIVEPHDIFGDGVNIAARLEGIAKPGAICLSEDAYRQVKSRLDLVVSDLGVTQLKNIAEPVRVYSLEVGKATPAKPTKSAAAKQRSIIALLGGGIVALIVIVGGSWYFLGANRSAPARPEAAHQSVVVLPFTNLSGDPSQDYFADGITENLTSELSRIRNTFVIAHNTAFTFKGKSIDAKEIGKQLAVRYVLEGSVQRYQDRVRVNVQLIDANSGAHLWADQFDAARADLLQMQDDIVVRLAYTLSWELMRADAQKSARSINPDAEDLALRCSAAVTKVGYLGEEADAGYRLCQQALDIDPNNIDALTVLPIKFYLPVMLHSSADPQADLKRADELASRALAVDPNYWSAHNLKGKVLRAEGRLDDAIVEFERAIALDPNSVDAVANLGDAYIDLGLDKKAIEFKDKAIRLSPYDPAVFFWYWSKSFAHLRLLQNDQAIEWARRAIAINPNFLPGAGLPPPQSILAAALASTGAEAEARDVLQRYFALRKFKSIAVVMAALAPLPSGDPRVRACFDQLIEGLRNAGMPEE